MKKLLQVIALMAIVMTLSAISLQKAGINANAHNVVVTDGSHETIVYDVKVTVIDDKHLTIGGIEVDNVSYIDGLLKTDAYSTILTELENKGYKMDVRR